MEKLEVLKNNCVRYYHGCSITNVEVTFPLVKISLYNSTLDKNFIATYFETAEHYRQCAFEEV